MHTFDAHLMCKKCQAILDDLAKHCSTPANSASTWRSIYYSSGRPHSYLDELGRSIVKLMWSASYASLLKNRHKQHLRHLRHLKTKEKGCGLRLADSKEIETGTALDW